MADLRFGTFLAPNMLPVYQMIADEVGKGLGMTTELIVETDYENCQKDVNDICFVCSLPYVTFERERISPAVPIAAPVLEGPRYQGKPIYFSDVIVHADSDLHSFEDLRGHSWSFNEPLSQSGYGIARYHLVELGETNGFFGEVIDAGFHETSIRMVMSGDVDASAIDSQVLGVELRDHPEFVDSLRVIDALGPSTIQPVGISKRFSPSFHDKVREILLSLHEDPETKKRLGHGMVEKFVAVGPESYDDIRRMLDACEAAGFMEII